MPSPFTTAQIDAMTDEELFAVAALLVLRHKMEWVSDAAIPPWPWTEWVSFLRYWPEFRLLWPYTLPSPMPYPVYAMTMPQVQALAAEVGVTILDSVTTAPAAAKVIVCDLNWRLSI